MIEASGLEEVPEAFLYPHVCNVTSTVFSAPFENLGAVVQYLIFPVGVDTFPTELSGRLRHVFSPAGAGPEVLLCRGRCS